MINLSLLLILLCVITVKEALSMKLVSLTVIKVIGSFRLPTGTVVPSVFLSRSKLEVLEDDSNSNDSNNNEKSSVILCDVLPILIQDPKGSSLLKEVILNTNTHEDSKSIPFRDTIQSFILNRDRGLYDNIPYAVKKGPSKKNLFDFFNNVNSKVEIKKNNKKSEINPYTSFLQGVEKQLDVKLTGLFIEVADEITKSSVALGGAAIFAKTNDAKDWILNQYNPSLPDIATTDEGIDDDDIFNSPAVVVYCGLDEIVGMSLGTGIPIYIPDELFDSATVDARLNNKGDNKQMSITAPVFGESKERKAYDALAENTESYVDITPAWEIFDPKIFLKMSPVEKREILRASGVKKLPRIREGLDRLDSALINVMDDAVRKEFLRLSEPNNSKSFTSTPRSEVLRQMGEALSEGDLEKAEALRETFIVMTQRLADPTQSQGSYDPYLDQDDWYIKERRKSMRPKM